MAAPTPLARALRVPEGRPLWDGYQSLVIIDALINGNGRFVSLWEKSVQPPGVDGGEPINTTTMHNQLWRTMQPAGGGSYNPAEAGTRGPLKTLTPITIKASYDPDLYTDLVTLVNRPGTITVWFPDDSNIAFYGFLQKVEFDAMEEGKQPECTATIVPTNWDPTNDVEAAPAVVDAAGT